MDSLNPLICLLVKDFKVPYNISEFANNSAVGVSPSEQKAVGLGALTGIFIAFVIDVLLSIEYKHSSGSFKNGLINIFTAKNVSRALVLTVVVLFLPIIILFLLLALVYKVICSVIIKKEKYFVEFLDSFDVFWSLEDDTAKSIINVFGVIESDSPDSISNNIKEKLKNVTPNYETEKIFYRRNEKYGFYYWRKYNLIDMDQYVEVIEVPNNDELLNLVDLENLMTDLQEKSLPYANEGLFKIYITRQRIGNSKNETKCAYGIIFRIHHSVGDGVALIEFLCKTFADQVESFSVNMFSMPENCNHDAPSSLLDMIQKLLQIPICFVDGILRKTDENALHGPSLFGKKVFKWTDSDENILKMVKEIKENLHQISFSDILITALSNGLRDFLSKKVAPVPDDVAVVLPVRFPKTSSTKSYPILKNDFSVTVLDVPVKKEENLNEIRNRCKLLRKSADPLTNYYFLKLVCSVFPKSVLQPLLNSNQATMVFSNLPGPEILSICGGKTLESLVFFVPHKGTTGLGVTALCYGGVLRFAAMADAALVSSSEDLAVILDGMVKEILLMHERYVK